APVTLAKAAAPLGAAALLSLTGGYPPVLAAVGVGCLIAAVGILARARTPAPPSERVAELPEPSRSAARP
ncbi:MAG TPA: MFS transporter, partial [Asanoa sp.]|nr:MFS transporter [Asanoa sp.]